MSDRCAVMSLLEETGVIAVVRVGAGADLLGAARALRAGGVRAVEITLTTPGALEGIAAAVRGLGDSVLVGAGSVLDAETARTAILAGAQYIVSPTFDPRTIEMAHRYDRAVIVGGLTPTEILMAWSAGSDAVKVFPANHFGPQYLRDLHGPMPQLKLTPTGGVSLETVPEWIRAGAFAVGAGSALVRPDLVAAGAWDRLAALASQYVDAVARARTPSPTPGVPPAPVLAGPGG